MSDYMDNYKPQILSWFYAKQAALRNKSKEWLTLNQDNVSEWSNMSTCNCCFSELAL
jgi:hypothetical protein